MKINIYKKNLSVIIMASMLTVTYVQADTNTPINKISASIKRTELPAIEMDSKFNHPDYNLYLLLKGRVIYEQLQFAKQAAFNEDLINVKVSLEMVRAAFKKLKISDNIEALDKQLGIIRRDLKDLAPKMENKIWVPVEATLSDALIVSSDSPDNRHHTIKTPISKHSVDSRLIVSDYKLGIFPLAAVELDIESAAGLVDTQNPYWPDIVEAIQNALADFSWYSNVPSQGLLAAYTDAVNAYTLASEPTFQAVQNQAVIDQLTKVVVEVKKAPDSEGLQSEAQALINKKKPDPKRINDLMQSIKEKIRYQHQRMSSKFMDDIGNEISPPE